MLLETVVWPSLNRDPDALGIASLGILDGFFDAVACVARECVVQISKKMKFFSVA